jgi:hypothetical protein
MDDFFDFGGAGKEIVAGPLIGGGLAQLGIFAMRKFAPSQAKWAGAVGTVLGAAAGAFLMSKPEHKEKGLAAVATAMLVGLPRQIEDLVMPAKLSGVDNIDLLGAYDAELAAYDAELADVPNVQVLNSGSGSTGLVGAIVPEDMSGDLGADADIEISDASAFGATGIG